MMSYGYRPEWSEGALKSPIFQTSTYVFKTAEEGKAFFELAYGLRQQRAGEIPGMIYTRISHPNVEILEDRLALWDDAEACAVFVSGMAAIATTLLEFVRPGDAVLYSTPLYGGTDHLLRHVLPRWGVTALPFPAGADCDAIAQLVERAGVRERNLASRLSGEIARTRALYHERVPPQLWDADEIFHAELVQTLAGGDASLFVPSKNES